MAGQEAQQHAVITGVLWALLSEALFGALLLGVRVAWFSQFDYADLFAFVLVYFGPFIVITAYRFGRARAIHDRTPSATTAEALGRTRRTFFFAFFGLGSALVVAMAIV